MGHHHMADHGFGGEGHHDGWQGHGMGGPGMPMRGMPEGARQFAMAFFVNALITQMFIRVWLVISAIALMKLAKAQWFSAKVKAYHAMREDLSEQQRQEMVDALWHHAQHKKKMCCSGMMGHGHSKKGWESQMSDTDLAENRP